jgi:hypothetical protein
VAADRAHDIRARVREQPCTRPLPEGAGQSTRMVIQQLAQRRARIARHAGARQRGRKAW